MFFAGLLAHLNEPGALYWLELVHCSCLSMKLIYITILSKLLLLMGRNQPNKLVC